MTPARREWLLIKAAAAANDPRRKREREWRANHDKTSWLYTKANAAPKAKP